ncbi:MAG: SDR family oxidoreductase [Chloroflexota bacterium]
MSKLFELEGRVALVTGALGQLGGLWIDTLLDAGARVVALDQAGVGVGEQFSALVDRAKGRLTLIRADIRDRDQLDAALEQCCTESGTPAILVNNAGVDQPPNTDAPQFRVNEIPADVFRHVIDVNLVGTFQVCQVFGTAMARAGRGTIINIGSLYASVAPDMRLYEHLPFDPPFLKPPAYGASKAGVVNLTRYLASLWGPSGVRVNALSPGGVSGGQDPEFRRKFCDRVPLGRMAELDDLRGPLLFLASDASAYVTGVNLNVDGGFVSW